MITWHAPPALQLGGGKVFAGGGGSEMFILVGGLYYRRRDFVGGSHNFEVKIKIA